MASLLATQPTGPSSARLDALPDAAVLAFGTRCALRILPAFIPSESRDVDQRAVQIAAANVCCLLALNKTTTYGARDTDVAALRRAVAALETSTPSARGGAAQQCAAYVGKAAVANPDEIRGLVGSAIQAYDVVAGVYATYDGGDIFDRCATDDVNQLVTAGAERIFERPLWGEPELIPSFWQPVVERWKSEKAVQATGIADLNKRMRLGGPLDLEQVRRSLDASVALLGTDAPQGTAKDAADPKALAATTRPPDTWMLADQPLTDRFAEQDRFEFNDYADALAAILDHPKTDTPFTMAINAPWGAGKTTLANMIAAQLEQRPRDRGDAAHIICRFNAWMHDDAPNLATAFVAQVGRTADAHRLWLRRIFDPLPAAVLEPTQRKRRQAIVGAAIVAATLATSAWVGEHLKHVDDRKAWEAKKVTPYQATESVTNPAPGAPPTRTTSQTETRTRDTVPPPEQPVHDAPDVFFAWLQSRMVVLGAFFTALAGLLGLLAKLITTTSLGGYVASPEKAAETGSIQSAATQLGSLIRQATRGRCRFVVFVDDIERCKPPRSIDVLDAVNQLMDHRGVIVVLLGDMAAVAAAAQLKYKDLAEIFVPNTGIALTGPDRGKEAFGRLYLQKIVQFQFDLPVPPRSRILDYLSRLSVTSDEEGDARDAATR